MANSKTKFLVWKIGIAMNNLFLSNNFKLGIVLVDKVGHLFGFCLHND